MEGKSADREHVFVLYEMMRMKIKTSGPQKKTLKPTLDILGFETKRKNKLVKC